MRIGEDAGMMDGLAKKMKPLLRWLFPDVPDDHPAQKHIATNFIANLLGLGWAATPPGLEAMKSLQTLNPDKQRASKAMCTFMTVSYTHLDGYKRQRGDHPDDTAVDRERVCLRNGGNGFLRHQRLCRVWKAVEETPGGTGGWREHRRG